MFYLQTLKESVSSGRTGGAVCRWLRPNAAAPSLTNTRTHIHANQVEIDD